MKHVYILITLLLFIQAISSKSYSQDEFPILKGAYLGQKPPGMIAEPFALGIISKEGWELEGVFAPSMKEFYFTLDRGKYILVNRGKDDGNVDIYWVDAQIIETLRPKL
jgi:hypothetical protein